MPWLIPRAPSGPAKPAPKPAGFTPIKTLGGEVLAGASPAKGELWLVVQDATGGASLQHLRRGAWTSERIGAEGSSVYFASLASTGKNDVWLSAAGTLRHYDGKRWSTVTLPKAADGSAMSSGPVASAERGRLYVALASSAAPHAGHVYRYERGAWTDLGAPARADSYAFTKLVAHPRGVSALVASWRVTASYDLVDGTWSGSRRVAFFGGGETWGNGGYFVDAGLRHLALGGGGFGGMMPTCGMWVGEVETPCTSTVVAGASDKLKNGSIVIGGNDYSTPQYPPAPGAGVKVEGRFVLRGTDGGERPLTGDPGDRTNLMVAEKGTNSAWAVTRSGGYGVGTFTLQRYDG